MCERQLVSSGSKWEAVCGYSRAIRVGQIVEVAGTVAVDDKNEVVAKNDMYAQAAFIFQKIAKALEEVGGSMKDVTRTRMFTSDITKWEEISRAHGEIFKDIRPVCTLVEVNRLVQPDLLIEIEVSAILSSPPASN